MVLRDVTPALIQDTMNEYFDKGYELSQFFVEFQPMHVYIAVMELAYPTRIPPLDPVLG